MNSAKYEATKDEFTLLFKEWERTVEAFNRSEEIIDHPEIRNVVREYFKYAIRDCTMAFARILDSLLDEKVEQRESFESYYAALKDWRESIDNVVAIYLEEEIEERRKF
jgi:hypothetical protein